MSNINPDTLDVTKPEKNKDAKTADLRANLASIKANFTLAKSEIDALEAIDAALSASDVSIATGVGSPTVDQLQEYIDMTGSAGFFTGGSLSDGGSGTVDIAAGEGFIRESASSVAPLLSFKWVASSGVAVTSDTTQYVFVDSTGTISLSTDEFLEAENKILIGLVINEGGTVHHTYDLGVRLDESIGQAGRFMRRVHNVSRDVRRGGLVLGQSEDANRFLTLTTGHLWWGKTDYTIGALDTDTGGAADTFDIYYRDGVGGTTKVADASAWPNTQYDDNSGSLVTLGSNKWGVLWFYLEPDSHLVMVYGRGEYTSEALALDEAVPITALPPRLSAASILIARMVFQKSSNIASLSTTYDETFVGSLITDHGSLAGLSDDDHSQYPLLAGRAGGQVIVGGDAASETLTLRATSHSTNGSIIFETDPTTEAARIDSNGALGIGETSIPATTTLMVKSAKNILVKRTETTGIHTAFLFKDGADTTQGTIQFDTDANTTAYNTSSDKRLKTNIEEFNSLELLAQMDFWRYERLSQMGVKKHGVIAQDLYTVFPEAVYKGSELKTDPWQIDYSKLVPVLGKAIQELESRLNILEAA